jgi:transcriptional regulator with XRE-family HTH domain
MNTDNYEINSETLKHYRKDIGFSQEDLACRVGVKANTVYRWETGKCKVRQSHQDQLASVLGASLKQLREPLPAHKKNETEKPNSRLKSTISEQANVALGIVSDTYHINRDAILDIAPFMFHVFAAASLGRRAETLDEISKEIETVMKVCNEKIPYITDKLYFDNEMSAYSLVEEQDAIEANQLFFSDSYHIPDDVNDISTNPFAQFLKSFVDLVPENLSGIFDIEWRNDELPKYHITESYIRNILLVPVDDNLLEQIMELVLNGKMQLKEINVRSVGFSDPLPEGLKGSIIKGIRKKVAEKQAAHQASKQPTSGEDQ